MKRTITTLATGFAGGLIAFSGAHYFFPNENKAVVIERTVKEEQPYQLTANSGEIPAQPVDFSAAAEKTVNSVVHIRTEIPVSYTFQRDPLFEYYFGPSPRQNGVQEAMGSGVILSDDGYIVTNNHVVNGASKISVTLNNNKSYSAKLIGADEGTDIAVLKIEAKGLPAIPMGNSDDVKIGEWVLAVGNPFNLNSTVTAGIVSAKSRNINILHGDDNHVFPIESFIQTDAAVNPGNSGGALVNSKGELIGINTAIASTTGTYSGYSFAVPVNLTQKVTGDLIRYGVVQRGFLGVNIRNIDQDLANEIGVDNLDGVYVGGLIEGGAGQKAGVEAGDIIVGVGPVSVKTVPELQEQIARFRPGDVVQLRLKRGQKDMLIPVTLLNQDGETGVVKKEIPDVKDALGASFSSLTKSEMAKYRINGGVKIASIGNGRLRSAGLKQGFIITKVDNVNIENVDQLIKILEKKKGQVAIEGIFPNGSRGMFSFPL